MRLFSISLVSLLGVAACGGGGGNSFSHNTTTNSTYTAGVYQPESKFANVCAAPRTGTDPITHVAYPDTKGTSTDENNWLRSWTNDLYLWYSEVPDQDPAKYTTPDYFNGLRSP
jgi:carboxyl-terminal processing protease